MPVRYDRVIEDDVWIACSPESAFEALTDAAELARWWPREAVSEPRAGGRLLFTWASGEILATRFDRFEPGRAVSFAFGPERVTLEVEPEGGGTRFRVRHECPAADAIHVAQAWGFLKANLKARIEANLDLRTQPPTA